MLQNCGPNIAFSEHQGSSVFIIGDHNAWVGTENDYIVSDEVDEFLSLPDNYIPEALPRRVHAIKNLTKKVMQTN